MSSKNITVYLCEKCPQGCFIRIVSKFFKEAPTFEYINTFSEEVKAKLLTYSPTEKHVSGSQKGIWNLTRLHKFEH